MALSYLSDSVSQPYGYTQWEPQGHRGIDLSVPFHTPLGAPVSGTISDISNTPWGLQVGIKMDSPWNNIPYVYLVHLDSIDPSIRVGQHVNQGDIIGLSGGENPGYPGALHPVSPTWSSGPHLHLAIGYGPQFGFGAGWWDVGQHPELNPAPFIASITGGSQTGFAPLGFSLPDFSKINDLINTLAPAWSWVSNPMRIIKLLFGILLLLWAFFIYVRDDIDVNKMAQFAQKAVVS